jgi:hypothetical protein
LHLRDVPRKRERSVVRENHSLYVGDMNYFPQTFCLLARTGRRRVRLCDPSNLNIVLSHVSCSDRSRGEPNYRSDGVHGMRRHARANGHVRGPARDGEFSNLSADKARANARGRFSQLDHDRASLRPAYTLGLFAVRLRRVALRDLHCGDGGASAPSSTEGAAKAQVGSIGDALLERAEQGRAALV